MLSVVLTTTMLTRCAGGVQNRIRKEEKGKKKEEDKKDKKPAGIRGIRGYI
jgi:hypothetical protein